MGKNRRRNRGRNRNKFLNTSFISFTRIKDQTDLIREEQIKEAIKKMKEENIALGNNL